jgi:hypothetical protein
LIPFLFSADLPFRKKMKSELSDEEKKHNRPELTWLETTELNIIRMIKRLVLIGNGNRWMVLLQRHLD